MKTYTLRDFAEQIIIENGRAMTTSEIWLYGVAKGYDKKGGFIGKTPWVTIGQKLMIDIKDNPASIFIVNETVRPKLFLLKTLSTKAAPPSPQKDDPLLKQFAEKDLHKHLTYFAYTYLERIYTKTIIHSRSKQRDRFKEWIHPDLVGVAFPVDTWDSGLMQLSKEMGLLPIKLFSFELKKRASFFKFKGVFFPSGIKFFVGS